jgi:hypothetical protein
MCKEYFLDTFNILVGRLDRVLHENVPETFA